jgi:AcrR family transcriptional regulator
MTEKSMPQRSRKEKQIVETAEKLFMRHGIKRVTVEEICQKAGVSKMTFYRYFPNKSELVKHIWRNWIDEGFEKFDEIREMDIAFPEKLQKMFEWKQELVSKMSTEFIDEFLSVHLDLEEITQRFFQFIVEAQERGEVRPEIRPEFLMAVLDKLWELVFYDDLLKKYPNIVEFNREIKDFFWYGIISRENTGSAS